jgi:D-aspartate ligase
VGIRSSRAGRPPACIVAGGIELVRALGHAGIRPVVVAPAGTPQAESRFAAAAADPGGRDVVEVLEELAAAHPEPPVLAFDADATLLAVSRARDRLAGRVLVALPSSELVEALVDKARFQALAAEAGLDVPRGRRVRPAVEAPGDLDLPFPLVLKAIPYRDERWDRLGEQAKALHVADRAELERLWPRLAEAGLELLAQVVVPGGEAEVLSYHVYVARDGRVAGEFTGAKIRTHPARFGHSSALTTTADDRVLREGRRIVQQLGLLGPAKLDFKRRPDGRLVLLEVNARFTLWVQAGALAGVNLPALAHADLSGRPLPPPVVARGGVRWIQPRLDLAAARAQGISPLRWGGFAVRCQSNAALQWSDLRPAWRRVTRR